MSKAAWIIRDEHYRMGAVLECLSGIVREVERGGARPDFELFHAILTYARLFLDQYHHPKEEQHLFAAVRRRCPAAAALLAGLEDEHGRGKALLASLRAALTTYEKRGGTTFAAFRDAAGAYVGFERAHALKEEGEVLPLAEEHLTDEDWGAIEAAFTDHHDPLFGDVQRDEFARLGAAIANMAPSPYGLRQRPGA